MEPRIQYAQTKDGVSIAFTTLGEGMPLVFMPTIPFSHFQLWLQQFSFVLEPFVKNRMLVLYDNRGSGLSDREVTDFSLEAHLLDLQAVVECLGLKRFALMGRNESGPVAIACAARHPEEVSQLILWAGWASASDVWSGSQYPALQALRLAGDWELFTETLAALVGLPTRQGSQAVAALFREAVTEEVATAVWEAAKEFEVTALLPEIKAPALVLHPNRVSGMPVENARRLASRIPRARLTIVDSGPLPLGEALEAVRTAIDEFLGEGEEAAPPGLAGEDVHTILFTDVEGSTALTQRLGDAKARELLRENERMVREALKSHAGSEFKTMGDGFMTSFSSATRALECAIAVQRAFAKHNESAEEPILVRVGLNAGEPIAEDDDLYGTAVNEAARITATAKGGEILVSDVVRQLAKGKDFMFVDRGEVDLKGFDEPVRLYEVRWREEG
jgi:class 3 adenylate cyclase